jgi:hypothetical protein
MGTPKFRQDGSLQKFDRISPCGGGVRVVGLPWIFVGGMTRRKLAGTGHSMTNHHAFINGSLASS